MSHISTKDVVIKEADLPYLKKAAEELGLVFNEGKTTWHWYGSRTTDANTCSHTLSVPNNSTAYEVGIVKSGEKEYKFQFDFFNNGYGLNKHIGENGDNLLQTFNKHKAIGNAEASGWSLRTAKILENGEIQQKFTLKKKLGGF